MELDLATNISKTFKGNLVHSTSRQVANVSVTVERLNDILIKIPFQIGEQEYAFRAMLSEQEEGTLMIIQDRVTQNYMLNGVSGFLHHKPNIHGGFISNLNSFYFHVMIQHFDGNQLEVYFMGKEAGEYDKILEKRSLRFRNLQAVN